MKKLILLILLVSIFGCNATFKDALDRYVEPSVGLIAGLCANLEVECIDLDDDRCFEAVHWCMFGTDVTMDMIKKYQKLHRELEKQDAKEIQ